MNAETRQKILDAAFHAILESGYRASVDDIARRAGVVKQTIYHHFAGKDALFAETVSRMAESVRVSLDEEPADLRSCLLRFAAAYREKVFGGTGISLHRVLVSEAARFPELARAVFAANLGETRRRLAATLSRAMALGKLRRDDPEFASEMLLGMLTGIEHGRCVFNAELPTDKAPERAGRIVDCFLRAFSYESTQQA